MLIIVTLAIISKSGIILKREHGVAGFNKLFLQNRRVENINTLPEDYRQSDIVVFLRNPYSRETELKASMSGKTSGILSSTLKYLALQGLTLTDDLSSTNAIIGCGIMDKRVPLIISSSGAVGNEGGRPGNKETGYGVKTDGAEGDVDSKGEEKRERRIRSLYGLGYNGMLRNSVN